MQRILITGGAGGLGSEAVKYIDQKNEETEVHVVDNDKDALEELENVEKHFLDVNNHKEIEKLSEKLDIDILVNCAGYQMQGAVEDMSIEDFEKHTQTNYLASVNCVKAFLPQLKNKEQAKIINVSSIAGKTGFPFLSAYCGSKYALEGFTDSLRKELLDTSIQVVLVEPGRVKTGFNENGVKNMESYLPGSSWSPQYRNILEEDSYGGISQEKAGKKLGKLVLKTKNKPRHTINAEADLIKLLKLVLPTGIYDRVLKKFLM